MHAAKVMTRRIFEHKMVSGIFLAALAFAAGGFAWVVVALRSANGGAVILHFNDIDGITQVGMPGDILRVGIFTLLVVLIDFAIALELDARDRVLGKIMAAVTLVACVLLFIACTAILNVN